MCGHPEPLPEQQGVEDDMKDDIDLEFHENEDNGVKMELDDPGPISNTGSRNVVDVPWYACMAHAQYYV